MHETTRAKPVLYSTLNAGPLQVRKRFLIRAIFAYAGLYGILACFFADDQVTEFIISLPALICAVNWCVADANERGIRLGRLNIFLLLFAFLVAFPIYLFRTRGGAAFKPLGWSVLIFLGFLMVANITQLITIEIGDLLENRDDY